MNSTTMRIKWTLMDAGCVTQTSASGLKPSFLSFPRAPSEGESCLANSSQLPETSLCSKPACLCRERPRALDPIQDNSVEPFQLQRPWDKALLWWSIAQLLCLLNPASLTLPQEWVPRALPSILPSHLRVSLPRNTTCNSKQNNKITT